MAVISQLFSKSVFGAKAWGSFLSFFCLSLFSLSTAAAVLPEDRADVLYHAYDGGGVEITGPSILIRKSIKDTVSISANYYVDNVSSASIDVVTTASAYTERRVEKSVGIDYLRDKSIISMGYTQSDENDFNAKSAHIGISQDFFGDLTTISLGYSQGSDVVGKRGDPEFAVDGKRRHFRVGLSQVITKDSILGASWETITDEGESLNNPYRSIRYEEGSTGYAYAPEVYPNTRTSDAFALRGMYYLPYRAALKMEVKTFTDTWGINADTIEFDYIHPWGDYWTFDAKVRQYQQDSADFYSDLFGSANEQNFMARDKEMSTFSSFTVGLGAKYERELKDWEILDKFVVNLSVDYIQFDFEDFRDLRVTGVARGEEPLYSYDANVIRFFVSVFY